VVNYTVIIDGLFSREIGRRAEMPGGDQVAAARAPVPIPHARNISDGTQP
jgi:hypothetical protein